MANISIKSQKITPFGGIFHVTKIMGKVLIPSHAFSHFSVVPYLSYSIISLYMLSGERHEALVGKQQHV